MFGTLNSFSLHPIQGGPECDEFEGDEFDPDAAKSVNLAAGVPPVSTAGGGIWASFPV
jgi:hypothetical protein